MELFLRLFFSTMEIAILDRNIWTGWYAAYLQSIISKNPTVYHWSECREA